MPELIKDKYYNYNSLSELAFRLKRRISLVSG